jgi:hypothetical protein
MGYKDEVGNWKCTNCHTRLSAKKDKRDGSALMAIYERHYTDHVGTHGHPGLYYLNFQWSE